MARHRPLRRRRATSIVAAVVVALIDGVASASCVGARATATPAQRSASGPPSVVLIGEGFASCPDPRSGCALRRSSSRPEPYRDIPIYLVKAGELTKVAEADADADASFNLKIELRAGVGDGTRLQIGDEDSPFSPINVTVEESGEAQ